MLILRLSHLITIALFCFRLRSTMVMKREPVLPTLESTETRKMPMMSWKPQLQLSKLNQEKLGFFSQALAWIFDMERQKGNCFQDVKKNGWTRMARIEIPMPVWKKVDLAKEWVEFFFPKSLDKLIRQMDKITQPFKTFQPKLL